MAKPRRATETNVPPGSELVYKSENVQTVFFDTLDSDGRFSRLGEHAGREAILIILK